MSSNIYYYTVLKEKGVMQMSRLADVWPRKFRENVAVRRLQAYLSA